MSQQSGVYQLESGLWTWFCPEDGKQGPEDYASRPAARTGYAEHRKTLSGITAPAVQPEQSSPPATTTKKEKKQMASKKSSKRASAPKRSRKDGPVAKARAIFAKMGKGAQRKDVLALCVKAGVNPATAATQYQLWMSGERGK